MSRINGDRSRFNRVRKARMHNRTRIRAIKKALETQETPVNAKSQPQTA
jgi:hypothetical protein